MVYSVYFSLPTFFIKLPFKVKSSMNKEKVCWNKCHYQWNKSRDSFWSEWKFQPKNIKKYSFWNWSFFHWIWISERYRQYTTEQIKYHLFMAKMFSFLIYLWILFLKRNIPCFRSILNLVLCFQNTKKRCKPHSNAYSKYSKNS